ncbi:Protein of unknown function [Cotesia congregata]|uniref:Uncharacterized protein n=1 Tax=Cotesia congregata TaxID=51543 RepID=A0A8J2HG27_COTCN|nr:Protein of unknown function [Cotesia congregata]
MDNQGSDSGISNFSTFMKGKSNLPNCEITKRYVEVDGEIMSVDDEFASNGDQKLTLENNDKSFIYYEKIHDNNNCNKPFSLPSTSKQYMENKVYQGGDINHVKDDMKGVRTALLKKGKKQLVRKPQLIPLRSDDEDYKQLHQRILKLIEKEKKLYNVKEPEPLYWCLMGSDYSYFTDLLLEAISKDLNNFSLMKERAQDAEAINIKIRIDKAHELLLMLYDCYSLIHHRLREFQKQHSHSRFYSSHLRITNLGYETKMELIEKQIEDLNHL